MVNSVVYTNDPLDRPVKQVSTEPGATITYDFTYVGVTNALSKEALSGTTTSTKPYAHDAFGRRATIAETVGATTSQYSYLYDPHTSVSLLIDQANTVKESYGYAAYGAANAALSKTAAGFSAKVNPYRYSGGRLDTGSGSIDLGVRRYSPGVGRWLQRDYYNQAIADFGLAGDLFNSNRYLFAGANPIGRFEVDGHRNESRDLGQPNCREVDVDMTITGQCQMAPGVPAPGRPQDQTEARERASEAAEYDASCRGIGRPRGASLAEEMRWRDRCAELWSKLRRDSDFIERSWSYLEDNAVEIAIDLGPLACVFAGGPAGALVCTIIATGGQMMYFTVTANAAGSSISSAEHYCSIAVLGTKASGALKHRLAKACAAIAGAVGAGSTVGEVVSDATGHGSGAGNHSPGGGGAYGPGSNKRG